MCGKRKATLEDGMERRPHRKRPCILGTTNFAPFLDTSDQLQSTARHPPSSNRKDVSRFRREVELPVHLASSQHQRAYPSRPKSARATGKRRMRMRRNGRRQQWPCDGTAQDTSLTVRRSQVDGKEKVMYALTKIKGVGRRYSNLVCKKADVDLNKRYIPPHPTAPGTNAY